MHLASHFSVKSSDLTLAELASIVEGRSGRKELISTLRECFNGLEPTGGLLNLPKHDWKSLYTTNYDNLIELSYKRAKVPITVLSSNFDFGTDEFPNSIRLMKLHGSIEKDKSDGSKSKIVVTEEDLDSASEYRQFLFESLKIDLLEGNLVIIGHSLSDPDIKGTINRILDIGKEQANIGSITLLMFEPNEERAEILEKRGVKVCFAGIDDFFASIDQRATTNIGSVDKNNDPLSVSSHLPPITIDVSHSVRLAPRFSDMFNGWPASYGDIASGHTFNRSVGRSVENELLREGITGFVLLGSAGVGKTTAARQILCNLRKHDFFAWEHKQDFTFLSSEWVKVATELQKDGLQGIVFVDDCENHLYEINTLFDELERIKLSSLRVLLTSAPHRWNPRVKSPTLFAKSKIKRLSKLNKREVDDLIDLTRYCEPIKKLVGDEFLHFSFGEQQRRLLDRCERDMFVCLRNIFASEKFDDILLREYANLDSQYQEIYKLISALESSGVRVHRQLIVRLLNIPPTSISTILDNLTGIVTEYPINVRNGIYGWRGRHDVISKIIADYKFSDASSFKELFDRVIGEINPTFDIEIRTLRELSSVPTGIRRLPSRKVQNQLLAKMISIAPGERVPRHRLVRNLIEMGEFERAETEIRLFTKDFGNDGPIYRYRVILMLERARNVEGILESDRLAILQKAVTLAQIGLEKFPDNKHMLYTYSEVGIDIYKRTKDKDILDRALQKLKNAEERLGDPDISKHISQIEKRVRS